MAESKSSEPKKQPAFALTSSRGFAGWLASSDASIAFTTYQGGKLFLIGVKPDGKLSIFERSFARSMGLAVSSDARTLVLATEYQLYRFDNVLPQGKGDPDGHDALYAPRTGWITGDCDIHDVAFDSDGEIVFVNTLFSCLATVSEGYSFRPLWKPPFITKLAAEDRCHLNGLAMVDGKPGYVTAVSRSDVADGWRDRRAEGGVVISVSDNEVVGTGLSMPHSPRWHDGRLWLLNSGTGEFGTLDPASGKFEAIAFCPGYARGLSFVGEHAVIGLSLPRNRTFEGLALDEELASRDTEPRCGMMIVDTNTGDATAWVRIEGVIGELYDVAGLPGVKRPAAIGFKTAEIKRVITVDDRG